MNSMAKRIFIMLLQNVHPLTSVLTQRLGEQHGAAPVARKPEVSRSSSYLVQSCQLSNDAFAQHVSRVCPSLVLLRGPFSFCDERVIFRNAVSAAW